MKLVLAPHHLNSLGIVHGAVYVALLDTAFEHTPTWCSVPGHVRRCVRLSLTTSFLAPATTGVIKAISRLDGVEQRIATTSGEVVDEAGQMLARRPGHSANSAVANGSKACCGRARIRSK
jgi:uncharacterized protein (TIGR00369 family)